nr:glycosyltransferase family 2 protein [uncultured Roseococcus sp.]
MADVVLVTPELAGFGPDSPAGLACVLQAKALRRAGFSVEVLLSTPCEAVTAERWTEEHRDAQIGLLTWNDLPPPPTKVSGTRWYSSRSLALMQILRARKDRCLLFLDQQGNGFWSTRAKRMGTGFAGIPIGILAHSPTARVRETELSFGENPLEDSDISWIEQQAIADADFVVTTDDDAAHWLRDSGYALPERVEHCPGEQEASALQTPPRALPDIVRELLEKKTAPLPAPALSNSLPGVSVCIAFYNHDRYLPRLVNSFLKMRNDRLQLVFVNDGTSDENCPIFRSLAKKLSPLGHIFHDQDNAGSGPARNKAVSLARHERIIFFDSDNVPLPNMVTDLGNALSHSGADIVSSPYLVVPPTLREPTLADVFHRYHPAGGSLALGLLENVLGDTCCITTQKVFEAIGGFETCRMYTDDWQFYLRAKGKGFEQIVHTDPLFFYTWEDNERRSQTTKYANNTVLWSRLETLDREVLAGLLRTYVQQVQQRPG